MRASADRSTGNVSSNGKKKPQYVKPYLEKLQWFADNDTNPVVRIHSAGAVRITKKSIGGTQECHR